MLFLFNITHIKMVSVSCKVSHTGMVRHYEDQITSVHLVKVAQYLKISGYIYIYIKSELGQKQLSELELKII